MTHKKAVITGANSGIGKSFAFRCAKEGYDLLLIARKNELLEECSEQITSKYHVNVDIIQADLSKIGRLECGNIAHIQRCVHRSINK